MNLSFPTGAQLAAFGRHVVTYGAGAVTAGVAIHFLTPDQGSQITASLSNIVSGVNSIVGGVATLVAVFSGLYAAWTASPSSQIKAVAANPDVSKVIAAPAVADAIPSNKVVSSQ
jgi:hypothetical protein